MIKRILYLSWSDYYPFGLAKDGRSSQSSSYRFGFQGQERDDEIAGEGTSWSFKYRTHNARYGRFFSVDPLTASYPYNSPYAFAENRVIDGIELEGLEWRDATQDEINVYSIDGNTVNQGEAGYIYQTGDNSYSTWVGEHQYRQPDGSIGTDRGIGPLFNEQITYDSRAFNVAQENHIPTIGMDFTSGLTVLNSDGSVHKQVANDFGMVDLPASGFGYSTYGRNDEIHPVYGKILDQWGNPIAISSMINMAAKFASVNPGVEVQYGDISMPDGGSPWYSYRSKKTGAINWTRHKSHKGGNYFDMRNIDNSGAYVGNAGNQTNIHMLQSFINIANSNGYNANFFGSFLKGKVSGIGLHFNSGHNNHYHFGKK